MNKTIILDVDGPLADTSVQWLHSLESMTGVKLGFQPTDYNLASYFLEDLEYEGLDGFEFWRMEDPYKKVMPVEGSIEACEELSSLGYRLLPVSKVYTEHTNSKRKWLNRWFPMVDDPIYISMNGYKSDVRGDYIIEDRGENLKGFPMTTKGVILNTPYLECYPIAIPYVICDNWGQILEYFEEESK